MTRESVSPSPWGAVALAALPGVLITLTRLRLLDWQSPVAAVGGWLVVALYAILTPIAWHRRQQMPDWLLMPLGMLAWVVTYRLANGLAAVGGPFNPLAEPWTLIVLINLLVAVIVFTLDRRARKLPVSPWSYAGVGLAFVLGGAIFLLPDALRTWPREMGLLFGGLLMISEALMLLALGLPVARSRGVLAVLVILGGYFYILFDSDYLWGFRIRDWAGLPIYLASMAALFSVVAPVAFLRARTTAGRAVGLFVPVLLFVVGRLVVPWMVLGGGLSIGAGDYVFSAIIPLTLLAGWWVYDDRQATPAPATPIEPPVVAPSG